MPFVMRPTGPTASAWTRAWSSQDGSSGLMCSARRITLMRETSSTNVPGTVPVYIACVIAQFGHVERKGGWLFFGSLRWFVGEIIADERVRQNAGFLESAELLGYVDAACYAHRRAKRDADAGFAVPRVKDVATVARAAGPVRDKPLDHPLLGFPLVGPA